MIIYSNNATTLDPLLVKDFFQGWPSPPTNDVLVKSIVNANYLVIAVDEDQRQLVGYITALSDDVLAAYIPFLEVIPSYQKQGIGHELLKRMLTQLEHLYMIDLICDKKLVGFYEESGLVPGQAMLKRNYSKLSGKTG